MMLLQDYYEEINKAMREREHAQDEFLLVLGYTIICKQLGK